MKRPSDHDVAESMVPITAMAPKKKSQFKSDHLSGSLKRAVKESAPPVAKPPPPPLVEEAVGHEGHSGVLADEAEGAVRHSHVELPHGAVVPKRSLSVVALFALLFSNCIGSGYGFEDAVGAGGPLVTVLFCLLVPWVWTLQTGLAVAELATSIPSNAGVLMWVNVSCKPALSFTVVLGTLFLTVVGNASYPSLAAEYVKNVVDLPPWGVFLVKFIVVAICSVLNVVGVEVVGSATMVMTVLTLSPFIIFSFAQLVVFHQWDWAAIGHYKKDIDWATFLSIVSWNFSNLENAGSVVEEVANPRRNLPRAIVPMLFSTYIAYLIPVIAGVSHFGANQDWSKWSSGYWSDVAESICGPWLKYGLFLGAIVTSMGYTLTSLCCTSRQVAGMGVMQVFPQKMSAFIGAYHPRFRTPVNAILINSALTLLLSATLTFSEVVSLSQVVYCGRLVFVYASLLMLRAQHPTLERPYAIPFGTKGTLIFLSPAIVIASMVAIMSAQQNKFILVASVCFILGSLALSIVYVRCFRPEGFEGAVVEEDEDTKESAGCAASPSGDSDHSPSASQLQGERQRYVRESADVDTDKASESDHLLASGGRSPSGLRKRTNAQSDADEKH